MGDARMRLKRDREEELRTMIIACNSAGSVSNRQFPSSILRKPGFNEIAFSNRQLSFPVLVMLGSGKIVL